MTDGRTEGGTGVLKRKEGKVIHDSRDSRHVLHTHTHRAGHRRKKLSSYCRSYDRRLFLATQPGKLLFVSNTVLPKKYVNLAKQDLGRVRQNR